MSDAEQIRHLVDASRATDTRTNYDLKKLIEDDKVYELLIRKHPEFSSLEPLFSPLQSLTYLPTANAVARRMDILRGIALIMECYVDERNPEAVEFLFAMQNFGETQAYDSQKGFKATTVTENKIRVDSPALSRGEGERKKFLGLF